MPYIYHAVPADLKGSVLHPLFALKDLFPEVYESEIKKYADHPQRTELPFKWVPKLNCRRGDVLHCSAIHPSLVFQAMKNVFPDFGESLHFFQIPLSDLTGVGMALLDVNHPDYEFGLEQDPETAFTLVNATNFEAIQSVPKEAYEFFESWKQRGAKSAPPWAKIPHLFVQGSIRVESCKVIDWLSKPTV